MDINNRSVLIRALTMILTPCLGLTAVVMLAAGFSSGASTDAASDRLTSTTTFSEVAGPRAYVPALRVIGGQTSDVGGWIEIQNVGSQSVVAVLTYWGTADNCAGSLQGSQHSDMLPPGASWRWTTADLRQWARSARVEAYTDTPSDSGQPADVPLAVAVGRSAPSPAEGAIRPLFTSYVAIPPSGLGIPGDEGQYRVVVPGVYSSLDGHHVWLNIQNAGDACTDVTLEFRELDMGSGEPDECSRTTTTCEIPGLAPGEALTYNAGSCVERGFLGSVWISSAQPLAIVADAITSDRVTSSRVAAPATAMSGDSVPNRTNAHGGVSLGQQSGWETALFVQNLSPDDQAKVKVYFVNSSGDIVKTVVDWICPLNSQVFPLSEIDGLPDEPLQFWVESQPWWTPGYPIVAPVEIVAAVRDTRYTDPSRSLVLHQIGYNLRSWESISGPDAIALPGLVRAFSDPTLPITTAATSRVIIANANFSSGDSEVALDLLDGGCVLKTITRTLAAGQVVAIDLADEAALPVGWRGSGMIRFTQATQTGEMRIAALVVDRMGQPEPNAVAVYEGVPLFGSYDVSDQPTCPDEGTPAPTTATPPPPGTPTPTATPTVTVTLTPASTLTPTPTPTATPAPAYKAYLPLIIGWPCYIRSGVGVPPEPIFVCLEPDTDSD